MAFGNKPTSTYVVKVLLDLKANDYRTVEKSMNVANSIYNDMLSEGIKRINKLRADKTYWKLIKDYNDAKEHNEKRSKIKDKAKIFVIDTKPISASINNMIKSYGLTDPDFKIFLRDRRHMYNFIKFFHHLKYKSLLVMFLIVSKTY